MTKIQFKVIKVSIRSTGAYGRVNGTESTKAKLPVTPMVIRTSVWKTSIA